MHVCMNIFKIDKQAHKAINQSIWFLFANTITASLKQKKGVNARMSELIVPDPLPVFGSFLQSYTPEPETLISSGLRTI